MGSFESLNMNEVDTEMVKKYDVEGPSFIMEKGLTNTTTEEIIEGPMMD